MNKSVNVKQERNIPSIDLHGEDRKTAAILVKQFLNDLEKMKQYRGVIIHGIGTGILKKEVHEVLRKDRRVEKFYMNFFNIGCTTVELKKIVDKK